MSLFGRSRNPEFPFGKAPAAFAMLSHTGRVRKGNEDTCDARPENGLFVVCDGMGGAAAGEVASKLAADTFLAHLAASPSPDPATRLEAAIHAANDTVYQHACRHPELRGMGTTLVALLLEPTSLTLAHVGDSRCYLFRDRTLTPLTQDHSLVEEQLRSGQITAAQALHHPMRNIITRAVGSQPEVEPEIHTLTPHPGDLYLLASDGLTRDLTGEDLANIFLDAGPHLDLNSLAQRLIDTANQAGGGDNITVLLLRTA